MVLWDEIDFIVGGTPVSAQSTNAAKREGWRQAVQQSAARRSRDLYDQIFLSEGPIHLELYLFCKGRLDIDLDNVAKPVLGAMNSVLYRDDRQISRLLIEKFESGPVLPPGPATEYLVEALASFGAQDKQATMVYVRVRNVLEGSAAE
jgi:hypothetical protein